MADALVSYAALILADAEVDITSDKLTSLIKAAGGSIDQIWTDVYAKALEGKDLKEILFSVAAAPAAGSAGAAASGDAAATEAAAEEEAEEEADESDDDMGFGLFD